jgi:hypothetical protein
MLKELTQQELGATKDDKYLVYASHEVLLLGSYCIRKINEETIFFCKFVSNGGQGKCLTKDTGSDNLGRTIDEYWERFERKVSKGRD